MAFTDRAGGVSGPPFDSLNLAATGEDDAASVTTNLCRVQQAFSGGTTYGVPMALMHQVHGGDVVRVRAADVPAEPAHGTEGLPQADGLVTGEPGVTLVVRVADCVPLLLADPEAGVVAALHVGRPGLVTGVVPHGVAAMRELGADPARIRGWIGPHVCGRCYEVPESMRADVQALVPGTATETSWGTPAVDLGVGVRSQLAGAGVQAAAVESLDRCTREDPDLFSYRRDGCRLGSPRRPDPGDRHERRPGNRRP